MTTVEFLYRCPTENITSALTLKPDKIIFIGKDKLQNEDIYTDFIASKSPKTVTDFIYTDTNDFKGLINTLSRIVETESDVIFDLTGGEDLLLAAIGVVLERYKSRQNIAIQRFDIPENKLFLWKNNSLEEKTSGAGITVEEQISLHGGMILENGEDEIILNDKSAEVIDLLWEVFKTDRHYNSNVKLLQRAMKLDTDELDLFVKIDLIDFKSHEPNPQSLEWLTEFLNSLKTAGLISFLRITSREMEFSFSSYAAKKLLGKEGNVLEMKVFKTAKQLKNKNGGPYYTDALRSVTIDWDGIIGDTKNEIDCILMKNLVPVFISCKCGDIEEVELYKLDAVARRFGGKFAKKVLVSTHYGKDPLATAHFRRRAADMEVTLLENVHLLNEEEFATAIKKLP